MADLVPEQGRELGLVVQTGENAPGAGDAAAGEGVGVDVRGVDHPEGVGHVRSVGPRSQGTADAVDVGVQGRVLDGAVVVGELHGRILPVDLNLLFLGDRHELGATRDRIGGATGGGTGGRDTRQPHELTAGQPVSIPQGTIV